MLDAAPGPAGIAADMAGVSYRSGSRWADLLCNRRLSVKMVGDGDDGRSVAVWSLILVGCGEAATPGAVAPFPVSASVTVASEPMSEPTVALSTSTTETSTTTSSPPTTSTSTTADAATPIVFEVEVEGVMLTVTLPPGVRPDPRPEPAAPVWAPANGSWLVSGCSCNVRFVVQTFVPPLSEPDRIDTFVGHGLTWDVYDTGHAGVYLSASSATPGGLWINVVGSGAPVDMIRAIASTVTMTGVRDAPLWAGRVDVDLNTGVSSALGFNEFVDTRLPVEARTPSGTALMLIGETNDAAETTTQITEQPGPDATTTVTITKSNLLDDSGYAVRYQVDLQQTTDTLFRFIDGSRTQQCQQGRGHQNFTTEPGVCTPSAPGPQPETNLLCSSPAPIDPSWVKGVFRGGSWARRSRPATAVAVQA